MSQSLDTTFAALAADLVHEDGPRISTMRNYRFCIAVYPPSKEFELRRHVHALTGRLKAHGWVVKSISLQALLLQRLHRYGDDYVQRLIAREKLVARRDPQRGLNLITHKLTAEIEGPDGLAADVAAEIDRFVRQNPDQAERTVVILGRAGALYPFLRSSALLKHIDGRTGNVPVVLLYPGERQGESGLSFMGRGGTDSDYRPRIYG
ncbi:MAG: BREX protein BrxB domain-containing protein [Nannocystaceae bacterium]